MFNNKEYMKKKRYKILFCDLDGTLIDTISGEVFPKGVWDMRFKFDVLKAIKNMSPKYILIATNQGGIENGFIDELHFIYKMEYIKNALSEYCECNYVDYLYCSSNNKNYKNRKPNVGMLQDLLFRYFASFQSECKKDCLMIGDASGKDGQFSDSDKRTAENFDIDYMDISDFVDEYGNSKQLDAGNVEDKN